MLKQVLAGLVFSSSVMFNPVVYGADCPRGNDDHNSQIDKYGCDARYYPESCPVLAAYRRDFPQGTSNGGVGWKDLEKILEQFYTGKEMIVGKSLPSGKGYTVSIKSSTANFSRKEEDSAPIILQLEIDGSSPPAKKLSYSGTLELDDADANLDRFLIVIDGKIHRRGVIVDRDMYGWYQEMADRMEVTIKDERGFVHEPPLRPDLMEKPLGCTRAEDGKIYGFSGTWYRLFGTLPLGKHELLFYVLDKKGNRAFAVTEYELSEGEKHEQKKWLLSN